MNLEFDPTKIISWRNEDSLRIFQTNSLVKPNQGGVRPTPIAGSCRHKQELVSKKPFGIALQVLLAMVKI